MMKDILFFALLLIFASCSQREKITDVNEYLQYLSNVELITSDPIATEMSFWQNRLKAMPGDEASLVKLAGLHAEIFRKRGTLENIRLSDSLYNVVLVKSESVEILQALAANAITQHKFSGARAYVERAVRIGHKKAASLLMLADIYLELGAIRNASTILDDFKNKNSFAYLIREAKIKDHEGKLDTAILLMEKAYKRVVNDQQLSQWAMSNLGDMYGHAGRIEDAYRAYLNVLKDHPDDTHSLKGIAWILISHERNTIEAKNIIERITRHTWMPEAHLMLAEIAALEHDSQEMQRQIKEFVSIVNKPGYKRMYDKYLCLVYNDFLQQSLLGLSIAEEEVVNRPTPLSYDLEMWSLYNLGDDEGALAVAENYVVDKTFEPVALYHLGMIYRANNNTEKAKRYLNDALQSEFELGPSVSARIREVLKTI